MYQYASRVIRVVDGDTLWLETDLGFDVVRKDSFRLTGINAPEMSTPEGKLAKTWLENRLRDVPLLIVTTQKDKKEKYGRYLATLWDGFGKPTSINQEMIDAGHAVIYPAPSPAVSGESPSKG